MPHVVAHGPVGAIRTDGTGICPAWPTACGRRLSAARHTTPRLYNVIDVCHTPADRQPALLTAIVGRAGALYAMLRGQ